MGEGWLANRSSLTDAGERRLVEAAGVEFELARLCNYLMATDFWANLCSLNRLRLPWSPLKSPRIP
jgi:hypothetical protein